MSAAWLTAVCVTPVCEIDLPTAFAVKQLDVFHKRKCPAKISNLLFTLNQTYKKYARVRIETILHIVSKFIAHVSGRSQDKFRQKVE